MPCNTRARPYARARTHTHTPKPHHAQFVLLLHHRGLRDSVRQCCRRQSRHGCDLASGGKRLSSAAAETGQLLVPPVLRCDGPRGIAFSSTFCDASSKALITRDCATDCRWRKHPFHLSTEGEGGREEGRDTGGSLLSFVVLIPITSQPSSPTMNSCRLWQFSSTAARTYTRSHIHTVIGNLVLF